MKVVCKKCCRLLQRVKKPRIACIFCNATLKKITEFSVLVSTKKAILLYLEYCRNMSFLPTFPHPVSYLVALCHDEKKKQMSQGR